MEFHERLRRLMDDRGISQAQLCKLTGIATSAMSHYVRGETDPSFTKAIQIARALDVPLDALATKVMETGCNPESGTTTLSPDEEELIGHYRSMDDSDRETLLNTARRFAAFAGEGAERSGEVPANHAMR